MLQGRSLMCKKLECFAEHEPAPVKIIWSVAAIYDAVMVGTMQDEVCEAILTTAAEPAHVVCLADIGTIAGAGRPATDLAGPIVEFAQLHHELTVSAPRLHHQMAASLVRQSGTLFA